MSASAVYRIKYRRRGWSAGRVKASDVYVSKRAVLTRMNKLASATKFYDLEPLVEMYVETGAVVWSGQLPGEAAEKLLLEQIEQEEQQVSANGVTAAEMEAELGYPVRLVDGQWVKR